MYKKLKAIELLRRKVLLFSLFLGQKNIKWSENDTSHLIHPSKNESAADNFVPLSAAVTNFATTDERLED